MEQLDRGSAARGTATLLWRLRITVSAGSTAGSLLIALGMPHATVCLSPQTERRQDRGRSRRRP
jgi:hypothetical protein